MANYAASVLAEAKLILSERFAAPEKRLKAAGVFGAYLKNSDLAMPNIGELRTSASRAEKAYFQNRTKRANGGARAFNHTGATGDSSEIAITWSTYSDTAQTSLKRSENNLFSDAQLLANELENMFKNIHEAADAAALTNLATQKSLINVATKNGVFDNVNKTFEIATADIARFIQHGKSMLRQNYYKGGADLILDPVLYLEAEHYLQQGGGNATNLGYQRAGVSGLYEAVTLSDANYSKGAGYFIPEGTIGVVDWIPAKNRQGYGDFESVLGGYGTVQDPITGLTYAIHGYSQRADTSAAGGDAQDVTTEWELSVDLSFNNTPLSVATESTIFEVGVIDAPGNI